MCIEDDGDILAIVKKVISALGDGPSGALVVPTLHRAHELIAKLVADLGSPIPAAAGAPVVHRLDLINDLSARCDLLRRQLVDLRDAAKSQTRSTIQKALERTETALAATEAPIIVPAPATARPGDSVQFIPKAVAEAAHRELAGMTVEDADEFLKSRRPMVVGAAKAKPRKSSRRAKARRA